MKDRTAGPQALMAAAALVTMAGCSGQPPASGKDEPPQIVTVARDVDREYREVPLCQDDDGTRGGAACPTPVTCELPDGGRGRGVLYAVTSRSLITTLGTQPWEAAGTVCRSTTSATE